MTPDQTRDVAHRRLLKARKLEIQLAERRRMGQLEGRRLAALAAVADSKVMRVWGFGSVFELQRPFRMDSDLDLATEGGGTPAWLASQKSPWSVDWVELGDQEAEFAAQIRQKGVLLYERL